MLPRDLRPEQFAVYPPLARKFVTENLETLRKLPLSFLPSLLREAIEFDYKFPVERRALQKEVATLHSLSDEQRAQWLGAFERIQVSQSLEKFDWVNSPGQFVEQLSSHLWTTHQQDAFHRAATDYGSRLSAAVPPEKPTVPRIGITVVGQGVSSSDYPLFRKLRPHGAYYTNVVMGNGLHFLVDYCIGRARANRLPYAHWYIDGGEAAEQRDDSLCTVAYANLETPRKMLLDKMQKYSAVAGGGPENLRTVMAALRPSNLHFEQITQDPIMARFQMKLLTEGSGTQVFSTTFAQWAARETLRRAQPLTMLVRFAPRQRQRPMNELLAVSTQKAELDPVGSLWDADMGAYYNWINQQRLPGAEQSAFIAWFEDRNQAVAIGPAVPRGTVSNAPTSLQQILGWTL